MSGEMKWPGLGDFVIWGVVLLVGFIVICGQCGCKTCDRPLPCPEPTPTVVTETTIVPCVIPVEPLGPYPLPSYPAFPGHDATDEELKAWALAMGQVLEERDVICETRENVWQQLIAEHNSSGSSCADDLPTNPP